ncbi:MAG TPA: DUF3185 family protein [Phycisphaerales bacterium]|nr:DUF3185 family protein [Phycisphaerales bacterium]
MHRAIGLGIAAVGVVLLIFGLNASDSPVSEISEAVTGEPTNEAMWKIIGGIAAIVIGLAIAALPARYFKAVA